MSVVSEKATKEQIDMIEEFQCMGCTCGGDTKECDCYDFCDLGTGFWCLGHSAGTFLMGVGKIALGLPTGFNKVGTIKTGFEDEKDRNSKRNTNIRFIIDPADRSDEKGYDDFNVPVWAMEKDGFLFVRVMCPRINYTYVDVIKGGKFEKICPNAINVANFVDEID
jgi:hypothetical protein